LASALKYIENVKNDGISPTDIGIPSAENNEVKNRDVDRVIENPKEIGEAQIENNKGIKSETIAKEVRGEEVVRFPEVYIENTEVGSAQENLLKSIHDEKIEWVDLFRMANETYNSNHEIIVRLPSDDYYQLISKISEKSKSRAAEISCLRKDYAKASEFFSEAGMNDAAKMAANWAKNPESHEGIIEYSIPGRARNKKRFGIF
jgi:hypothetical protein